MDTRVRAALDDLRAALHAHYGARLASLVLFGSRARGDADADADIDVLVVLHGPVRAYQEINETSHVTAAISLAHDVVLQRMFVSAEDYRTGDGPLMRNVRREGVAV